MAERITDKLVQSIEPPERGQKIYFDGDTDTQKHITGFGVRVTVKGAKAFILEYWLGGRQRRYTIGKYPDWSVERARKRAKELRQMVNLDQDPMDQRNKLRTDPTVKKLAERYYEEHLPTKAPQSQIDDRTMIEDEILPRLGKRKVAEIHYNDIKALHRSITDRGAPVRANRVLAVCSKMFSLTLVPRAGETDRWRTPVQGNPCKGVERNSEAGREHFYSATEIERIADALERFPGRNAANLIRFVMLTGCRPGEAMKATWDQFDFDAGSWTKPGATTKQRKTHRIPLAAAAIELLQHIRADKELPQNKRKEDDCSFVFPGRKRAGQDWQSLTRYRDAWQFVTREAELEPDEYGNAPRVYDLRHSFATAGVGAGLSLPIIGKLLGHSQARTTQRYAHADDDPLRKAADKIADHITNAGKGGVEGETVTPIRGGPGA